MVCRGQVSTAGALVADAEKKNAFLTSVLELLEVLALHAGCAFDLQVFDLVGSQRFSDLLHEVWKLNKNENTLVLWDTSFAK